MDCVGIMKLGIVQQTFHQTGKYKLKGHDKIGKSYTQKIKQKALADSSDGRAGDCGSKGLRGSNPAKVHH